MVYLLYSSVVLAEESKTLPEYVVLRTSEPIKIDGKLDEPAWLAAPTMGPFRFAWYKQGQKEQTVAKLLWDDENLYIAHICQDAHITGRTRDHDGPVSKDDCFEIMIAPNPERLDFYYNIEWNMVGGYVDGHRPQGSKSPSVPWVVEGAQFAGSYVGTLNDDNDKDTYWVGEVAIPFKNFAQAMPHTPPQVGYQWRINLNRHGGDTNMQYSQWSPSDTPQPAFHAPHCFGSILFSNNTSPFELP